MQIFIQSHRTSSGIVKKFNETGWKFACKVIEKETLFYGEWTFQVGLVGQDI